MELVTCGESLRGWQGALGPAKLPLPGRETARWVSDTGAFVAGACKHDIRVRIHKRGHVSSLVSRL